MFIIDYIDYIDYILYRSFLTRIILQVSNNEIIISEASNSILGISTSNYVKIIHVRNLF